MPPANPVYVPRTFEATFSTVSGEQVPRDGYPDYVRVYFMDTAPVLGDYPLAEGDIWYKQSTREIFIWNPLTNQWEVPLTGAESGLQPQLDAMANDISQLQAQQSSTDARLTTDESQITALSSRTDAVSARAEQVKTEAAADATTKANSALNDANAYTDTQVAGAKSYTDAQVASVSPASATTVNAKDYGAVGDGVADDTTPIQNAMNAAGVKGITHLPPGRYKITGLTIPSGVTLRGSGKGVTTLVQSGAPSLLIQTRGSQTAGVTTLTASALPGATTLTVADTSGLAAGDIIALHDTYSYNPNDASYKSGEQLRIKSVDTATQVTVYGTVRGSWATSDGAYTVANGAQVTKLNMRVGGGMADLSIEGDQTSLTTLFFAQYVDRLDVRNIDVTKGGNPGIRFDGCRDVTVTNYTCRDLVDDAANSHVGYAIHVTGPTENLTVNGGVVARVRHAITTAAGTYGMPHSIVVSGMVVTECTNSGLDTHAAGEDILFTGCVVVASQNGVNLRSRRTTVSGCHLFWNVAHGINLNETVVADITVMGNTIRYCETGHGIVSSYPVQRFTIVNNVVDRIAADGIRVDSGSSAVRIVDNLVTNVGWGLTGRTSIVSWATNGGTPATTGWYVARNTVGQDAGVGSASYGVNTQAGSLTGAWATDNRAFGAFSTLVFNVAAATAARNVQVDVAPPAVTGSRQGNPALAAILTQLAGQGMITDSTTAGNGFTDTAWTAYTPVLTGITIGNGTITAAYARVGKTVHVRCIITMGSTTTFTATTLLVALPVAASGYSNEMPLGPAMFFDGSVGTASRTIGQACLANSSVFFVTPSGTVTNTSPWTWANADKIMFSLTYEGV